MENPISIQLAIEVQEDVIRVEKLIEQLESAKSIVLLNKRGDFHLYPIDSKEFGDSTIYVDLLFDSMSALKSQQEVFQEVYRVCLENECGELSEVRELLSCSVVEVAEHSEFETVMYNPISLDLVEY